jgi:hypothetical protein
MFKFKGAYLPQNLGDTNFPFELKNFPKFITEAACHRISSETTEQSFMKLDR